MLMFFKPKLRVEIAEFGGPSCKAGDELHALRAILAVEVRCLHLILLALALRLLPRLAVLPKQPVAAISMMAAALSEMDRHPC